MLKNLEILLVRELNSVKKEVLFFLDDELLWSRPEGITNSAGNLVLHLCGNLNHFVGNALGGNGYVRDREKEFSTREYTKAELIKMLSDTIEIIHKIIPNIDEDSLEDQFPVEVAGMVFTKGMFLLQLEAHISFHLGQIGYLRRIVCADNRSTEPMSLQEIKLKQ